MVQALFDEGALVRNGAPKVTRSFSQLRLPATVQGMLAARIDRLSPEQKDLLQTLAVIGRESPLGLIERVTVREEAQLEFNLADLRAAEFIYEQPALAGLEYVFKHALTQEVAYNSILIERRRLLHEHVAAAIEALYKDGIDDHLAELAHHYSHSANTRKAVEYLFRAGSQAEARFAYNEAVNHLSSALKLLKQLPDDNERARLELSVQSLLAAGLGILKGFAAVELGSVYARTRELCAQIRDPLLAFRPLYGQWLMRWWQLELQTALELSDEMLALAEQAKDPEMLITGNRARGTTLFFLGEFVSAKEHLERALAVFGLHQPLPPELEARRLDSLSFLYFCLWVLGYPDRAWTKSREMQEMAQRSSDPNVLAQASCFVAIHNLIRGNGPAAQRYAEESMTLTEERGLVSFSAMATTASGAALIIQGRCNEGITRMRSGLSAWRATGGIPQGWYLSFLAAGLAKVGRLQEALDIIEEGIASIAKTREQLSNPSLHQVKGELLMLQNASDRDKAEQCYRTAIEIARGRSAKSQELRATTSLARLLAKRGKDDEARVILAEICNWFTEGFDTADLKNAKALLDELSN